MPIGHEYSEKPFGRCRRCWNLRCFRLCFIGAHIAIVCLCGVLLPLLQLLGNSAFAGFLELVLYPFLAISRWLTSTHSDYYMQLLILVTSAAAFGGIMANVIDVVIRKSRIPIAGRGRSIQSITHAQAIVTGQVANSATPFLHKPFVEFVLRFWAIGPFALCAVFLVGLVLSKSFFFPIMSFLLRLAVWDSYDYLVELDMAWYEGVITMLLWYWLATIVFCCTYGTILALLVRGIWRKFFAHQPGEVETA